MELCAFLAAKPLYYDEIDYSRMPRIYAKISHALAKPKIIHIVGTNGKGSTGRFIANALHAMGYRTGHYTSPHILHFNERIWMDGSPVEDILLEEAHERLYGLLSSDDANALSYFEYTTLLAMVVYAGCDYVVMEAGLGGEHDATAVFEKRLSLFTPIGFDHEAFLGDTIVSIATTKFNAMQTCALIGYQPYAELLYPVYRSIAAARGCDAFFMQDLLSEADVSLIERITQVRALPRYMQENLQLALSALRLLAIPCGEAHFSAEPLFGRLSRIAPNILLDVGHNVLAAQALCDALLPKQVVLIYNSYRDKDYNAILQTLKPVIESVEIIMVEDGRIETREKLCGALERLQIPYRDFSAVDESKTYLVFGSFSVAEAFLNQYEA